MNYSKLHHTVRYYRKIVTANTSIMSSKFTARNITVEYPLCSLRLFKGRIIKYVFSTALQEIHYKMQIPNFKTTT